MNNKTHINTKTHTYTYAKTRLEFINDQFELFFRYAGLNEDKINKLLSAIKHHYIKSFGIYVIEDNCRIAEVSIEIDWEKHNQIVKMRGDKIEKNISISKYNENNKAAPEAYVAVKNLVAFAKDNNLPFSSWIIIDDKFYDSPTEYKKICDDLGYGGDGKVPEWKAIPITIDRKIEDLEETTIIKKYLDD